MAAARSVNHRGLSGGGGLWICMRRLQQLLGRVKCVYVRGRCVVRDFSLSIAGSFSDHAGSEIRF